MRREDGSGIERLSSVSQGTMRGSIKSVRVVGSPEVGDTIKLEVVYDASGGDGGYTIGVVAYDSYTGQLIGFENTTHWSDVIDFSVQFSLTKKMPSEPFDVSILLYGHPDAWQNIEDYVPSVIPH